jgi:hypothetical protein
MPERAEIEAVATIIERWKVSGAPTSLRNGMLIPDCTVEIVAYLDRVRDARGDDEAARCCCGNGEAEEDRGAVLRCPVHGPVSRSPQGEDHEAAEWPNVEMVRCRDVGDLLHGHRCGYAGRNELACPNRLPCPGQMYAPLSRVSPSRDGTVAVEDWRTTATRLASLLRELHPQNPYYREKQAEALAAFDALAGESNEGGNQ